MISSRQSKHEKEASFLPIETGWRRNEEEKAGRLVLAMTVMVMILLVLLHMVAPPGSLKPVKAPEPMTAQQAVAALSGIGRDESCIQGTAANGQNLQVKKVSPLARELYDKGHFRLDGLSSPPSGDQFFNDPQQAIEVMGNQGVTEFRQCPLSGR